MLFLHQGALIHLILTVSRQSTLTNCGKAFGIGIELECPEGTSHVLEDL